ncbi:MAG: leucine-rich repeat domain-containing protein, partial [archaeon]|nr:leucine-rich repeat domain-containing protein [archaeon]
MTELSNGRRNTHIPLSVGLIKKTLCLVLMVAAALAVSVAEPSQADTGDFAYTLEDGVLTLTGTGPMPDYHRASDSPWYGLKGTITSVVVDEGISSIGMNAFYTCGALKSVSLPSTLASIGDKAFYQCYSLEDIDLSSVSTIGSYAFNMCKCLVSIDLTSLTIPGSSVFYGCSSLETVTVDGSLYTVGTGMFYGCTSLKGIDIETAVSIGNGAFQNCTSMTYVSLPADLEAIEDKAFQGCSSLEAVTIPDSVRSIGSMAFYGCTSLAYVSVPDSVTNMGGAAFTGCTSLNGFDGTYQVVDGPLMMDPKGTVILSCAAGPEARDITIPTNVSYIGNDAFRDCTNLRTVTMTTVKMIGVNAFYNCGSLEEAYLVGVSEIRQYAFYNCVSLKKATVSDDLTTLGNHSFQNTRLVTFDIPSKVTSVGVSVFDGCTSLEHIGIPGTVRTVESNAFNMCVSLKELYIPAGVTVKSNAFGGLTFTDCGGNPVTDIVGKEFVGDGRGQMHIPGHTLVPVHKDPTCTEKGYDGTVCTVCGETFLTEIPAPGHTFTDEGDSHACTVCGFTWSFDAGTGTLKTEGAPMGDFPTASSAPWYPLKKKVVIVEACSDVGANAFSGYPALTTITISDTVTKVARKAFAGCPSVTEITVGKNVSALGYKAFDGLTFTGPDGTVSADAKNLRGTVFSGADRILCMDTAYGTKANVDWSFDTETGTLTVTGDGRMDNLANNGKYPWFRYRPHITALEVEDGVTSVGTYAFRNYASLTSVVLADSVATVYKYAFSGDTALEHLETGKGLRTLGYTAFEKIFAMPDGSRATVGDGMTFDMKDGRLVLTAVNTSGDGLTWAMDLLTGTLTLTGGGKMVYRTCPSQYSWYAYRAFVETLNVSDGVTCIGPYAFKGYTHLTSVTFSDTVDTVCKYAFDG